MCKMNLWQDFGNSLEMSTFAARLINPRRSSIRMKDKKSQKVEISTTEKVVFNTTSMDRRYKSQEEDLKDIIRRRQVGQETLALMVNLS